MLGMCKGHTLGKGRLSRYFTRVASVIGSVSSFDQTTSGNVCRFGTDIRLRLGSIEMRKGTHDIHEGRRKVFHPRLRDPTTQ